MKSDFAKVPVEPRALTSPALWITEPNSKTFSVMVVLPASGWEIIAKVLRLFISFNVFLSAIFLNFSTLKKLRVFSLICACFSTTFKDYLIANCL